MLRIVAAIILCVVGIAGPGETATAEEEAADPQAILSKIDQYYRHLSTYQFEMTVHEYLDPVYVKELQENARRGPDESFEAIGGLMTLLPRRLETAEIRVECGGSGWKFYQKGNFLTINDMSLSEFHLTYDGTTRLEWSEDRADMIIARSRRRVDDWDPMFFMPNPLFAASGMKADDVRGILQRNVAEGVPVDFEGKNVYRLRFVPEGSRAHEIYVDSNYGYVIVGSIASYTSGRRVEHTVLELALADETIPFYIPVQLERLIFDQDGLLESKTVHYIEVETLRLNQEVSDDLFTMNMSGIRVWSPELKKDLTEEEIFKVMLHQGFNGNSDGAATLQLVDSPAGEMQGGLKFSGEAEREEPEIIPYAKETWASVIIPKTFYYVLGALLLLGGYSGFKLWNKKRRKPRLIESP